MTKPGAILKTFINTELGGCVRQPTFTVCGTLWMRKTTYFYCLWYVVDA